MSRKRWRWVWPVLGLLLLLAVGVGLIAVELFTREPPNYAEVEPGLFVGGRVEVPPRRTQAVLNLCEQKDSYQSEFHSWQPIRDSAPAPSLDWLREQVAFIETHQEAEHVTYIHCRQGVSRSVMVLMAYLMKRHRWSVQEALNFVKTKRDGARPNPGFRELLNQWEAELKQGDGDKKSG